MSKTQTSSHATLAMPRYARRALLAAAVLGGGLSFAYRQRRPVEAAPVLAALVVSNADDSGDGSLRKAIQDANAMAGDDTITFATPFFSTPRMITLTTGELAINSNLTITGPGANLLTVRRADNAPDFRLFTIPGGSSNVTLSGLTISNGRATAFGGGIESQSNLTLTNVQITGNQATNGGGGISLLLADGTFTGCTFSGNTAGNQGGGILSNSPLALNRCIIANNTATTDGGGVYLQAGATGAFTASTISGNTANNGGGVYFEGSAAQLLIINCTISGNTGTLTGGALVHFAANTSLTTILSSTIANNNSADGGGIFIHASSAGVAADARTRNSIYANNTNTNLRTLSENGGAATISSLGHNLTTGGGSGLLTAPGDQINTDPRLGPLQNNGGPTPTHALLFGSPALDKGTAPGIATDQRGVGRPVDDPLLLNATGGDGADIGAFERSPLAVVSAANFKGAPIAQESIVALFGENLTAGTAANSGLPLPLTLANTSVSVRDARNSLRAAPLFFVSPGQLNFQIPPDTAIGEATLAVLREGAVVASVGFAVSAVEPALFTANANGAGVPAAVLVRGRANGTQVIEPVAQLQGGAFAPIPINLGPAGEQVILVLFGTGIRNRSSLNAVTLTIGTPPAQGVDFAGAQGLVGLDQINSRALPRSLAGTGTVNVQLTVDGKPANVITLNFQ